MKNMTSHWLLLITLTLVSLARPALAQLQVETQYGIVEGQANGAVTEFLGIPYASPPVDSLRWKKSIPPAAWSNVLTTQTLKPKCPQKSFTQGDTTSTFEGDEDCLYLNIWTHTITDEALPVMVFIHGGGNQQGSIREIVTGTQLYDSKNLSERGKVVVVTIQYRLGALGYLVHPGLEEENSGTSGNYAVTDHLLALQWIKQNIRQFGGDSGRTMIFGESAGGVNVGNLLVTPEAKGLFSRACIQSASANLADYAEASNQGIDFVHTFAPTGSNRDKIDIMRSLPVEQLVASLESPLSGGIVSSKWKPVVDGHLFPDAPLSIIQSGNFNQVPLIIGSNADEVSRSAPPIVGPAVLRTLIKTVIPSDLEEEALRLYPIGDTPEETRNSYIQFLSDVQFTATTRRIARCISQNQDAPVFRYFFSHKQAGPLRVFGAYHGIELFYIFNNWENSPIAIGPLFTEADQVVQADVLEYWTNFAYTGNPNGGNLSSWPTYEAIDDCYLEINAESDGSNCGIRREKCDFLDRAFRFVECESSVSDHRVLTEDSDVSIFPNPATTDVFIRSSLQNGPASISLYQLDGKKIWEETSSIRINISALQPGVYMLKVMRKNQAKMLKLIKR
ncbi:MAG: carboxylesterase family protein [Saprospiraceae bacterium]|nr:carboxylesterase family protein [Saprospiraceae bacterium]